MYILEYCTSQSCPLPSPFPAITTAAHHTQRLSGVRTAAVRLAVATLALGCTLNPPLVTEQSHFVSPAVKALAAHTKVHGSRKGEQWRSDLVGCRRQGARGSTSGLKAALTCRDCRWRATCRLVRAYRPWPCESQPTSKNHSQGRKERDPPSQLCCYQASALVRIRKESKEAEWIGRV